jgi:hypothetical protein
VSNVIAPAQDSSPREAKNTRKARQHHWQTSSITINKRTNSATTLARTKSPSPIRGGNQRPPSASNGKPRSAKNDPPSAAKTKQLATANSMFLDYSKLVEIESNLEREYGSNVNVREGQSGDENHDSVRLERPKTAAASNTKNTSVPLYSYLNDDGRIQTVKIDVDRPVSSNESAAYDFRSLVNNLTNNDTDLSNSACCWLELPDEIWLKILEHLNHSSLARFGQTCKAFSRLYLDNTLCNFL